MEIPDALYTTNSLFTLSGAATAVWIITGVLGYVFEAQDNKKFKKRFALILSIVLSLIGLTQLPEQTQITGVAWVVAIINGFLIYLTAVGANTIVGQVANATDSGRPTAPPVTPTSGRIERSKFTELWW